MFLFSYHCLLPVPFYVFCFLKYELLVLVKGLCHLCCHSAFQSLSLQWPGATEEASTEAEESLRMSEWFSVWSWLLPPLSFRLYSVLRISLSLFSLLMVQHILSRPSHYLLKSFCIWTDNFIPCPPSQVKRGLWPSLNTIVPCWEWWCSWSNNCITKEIQFSFLLHSSCISIFQLWPIPFILYSPDWSNISNSSGLTIWFCSMNKWLWAIHYYF